ncbi:MAG: alpha/beta hydrolase, partial [Pseudomonadota bacterium]
KFTPTKKPLESLEGVDSFYDVLDMPDGSHLRTIITTPAGVEQPLPALFLTQWVSCGSIELSGRGATRAVLKSLATRSGMAMIRVERAANGDSEGPACHELDYDTEVAHYRHAFAKLSQSPKIDANRIVIIGMSLGSTTAPLVAEGNTIAGITIGGGGATTYFERMVNFDRIRMERSFEDPAVINDKMVQHILFHTEYLLRGKTPEQVVEAYPELKATRSDILGLGDGEHYGRPYAYHQQAARKNFLKAWSQVNVPVLVTYGEYDQFELRYGHEMIARLVNRLRPGSARFELLPKMDHDYGVYASAEDAYSWVRGDNAPGHDAPEVLAQLILRWLRDEVGIKTSALQTVR